MGLGRGGGSTVKMGWQHVITVSKKMPAKVIDLDTELLTNYCDGCSKINARKTGKDLEESMESHAKNCRKITRVQLVVWSQQEWLKYLKSPRSCMG